MECDMRIFCSKLFLILLSISATQAIDTESIKSSPQKKKDAPSATTSSYPVKRNIVTTYFWIGQGGTSISSTQNIKSAWDEFWKKNFGGIDAPEDRKDAKKFREASLPEKFAPTLNPFYVALPFNDIAFPEKSRKYVPWWSEADYKKEHMESQCKGRWVMIKFQNKVCFAQWEDVGPLRYDHAEYVFGDERPTRYSRAGLDVSPAVRDYLGLSGLDKTDWKFVEDDQVPYGPWIEYGEQAILYSAIKGQTAKKLRRDL
jgi:hypothetical protein